MEESFMNDKTSICSAKIENILRAFVEGETTYLTIHLNLESESIKLLV
jgi:hypothetical protein